MSGDFIMSLADKVKEDFKLPTKGIFTFLNPYSYLHARKHWHIFREFDAIYIDGILLVTLLKIFKIKCVKRISFDMTSIAFTVFKYSEQKDLKVFIIGTKEQLIEKAVFNIKKEFPALNIVGYRHGYFSNNLDKEKVLSEICEINPDVIVVGMGTPMQEYFLVDLKYKGWDGLGFTCGGFLHQSAKRLNYYPQWINKLNLRWTYRLYDEPRLFSRYLYQYPKFFIYFASDIVKYYLSLRSGSLK